MRTYLSLCLIVLLALRGLLGDAMAMNMVPMPTPPTPAHAAHAAVASSHHASPSAHAHPGASLAVDSVHLDADCTSVITPAHCKHSANDAAPCHHCTLCAVCHSAWGPASPALHQPPTAQAAPPVSTRATLASAPQRSVLKPPIV